MDKKRKLSKQSIILIIICVVIVALVIAIAVIQRNNRQKQQTATTTSAVSESEYSTTEYNESDVTGKEHIDKKGKTFVLMQGKERIEVTGLYYCKLPGTLKKDCYYFTDGVYDKSYKGVAVIPFDAPEAKYGYAYVKNGKMDRNYTGLISRDNYLRVFENGKYRYDYNGEIHLPDGDYDVKEGAIRGYMLGRPDNFECIPIFWSLDGEPTAYHNNS